jgi:hypothetical protein
MNVKDLDPDQVGSGSFWSDPDLSRSYGSLQHNLSALQSKWNLSYSKSTRSEIPDFTSVDVLLNRAQL